MSTAFGSMTRPVQLTERINRIEPSATMLAVAEAEKLRQAGVDVVDMTAGEPHFTTPEHIKEAAIAAIRGDFSRYTAVGGTAELKDAIIQRHATDFGSAYKREETCASVGGKHALFNAISVLVDHGDEVILPVPYWVSFKDMVRYVGGHPVLLKADESQRFRVTALMVARMVTPKTKLIILNSPSNPSGAVMSPEDMTEVVRLAHERGIWVISDECYVYLNYTDRNFSVGELNEYRDQFLVVGSLSKTYAMTGWRLGYTLGPASVVGAIQKLQSQSTSNPTSIVQKAAAVALSSSQQCVADMRADYMKLRDHIVAGLQAIPGIKCTKPEGAFYAFPNVSSFIGKSGMTCSADIAHGLLHKAHVATVAGEGFGTTEHIRISYASSIENIDKALERMRKYFEKL
ncbi:MAG: pyridoxal phosphate-dependent aminotransferase [Terriglobales bacterium]